jgi:hypothetical protein
MASVFLSPIGGAAWQFFTDEGVVLSGGLLYTYLAGTTTPAATFTTAQASVTNPNPIVLNSSGRTPNEIWLSQGTQYKFVVEDANHNLVTPGTWDNISGINDVSISSTQSPWVSSNLTPTYISATQFSVPGNQTTIFTVNRRIQAVVGAGTVYGYVSASSFGSGITTVTVVLDAGALDAGLSQVFYASDDPTHTSTTSLLNVQTFTSSGTYTPTNGATKIMVRVLGAGGAGGGALATDSIHVTMGQGGGAGGYAESYISGNIATQTVTIGAGGVGTSGGTGGTGGTTSFGSLITCNGGVGGIATSNTAATVIGGAVGGTATGGSILNIQGANGPSTALFVSTGGSLSGPGGSSQLGSGGVGAGGSGNGFNAYGYGAGGSGAINGISVGSNKTGGSGSGGIIIVYEYV